MMPERDTNPKPARGRDEHGRWLPGQSGNPQGRPSQRGRLTRALRTRAGEPADGGDETRAERLAETVWRLALGGERWAVELIFNRLEGRVPLGDLPGADVLFVRMPLAPPPEPGDGTEGADE